MKYILKRIEVDAFQFDGDMMTSDGKYYVPEWAVNALKESVLSFRDDGKLHLHRCIPVCVGDYIIRDVDGVIYIYVPDAFEKMYELVEE